MALTPYQRGQRAQDFLTEYQKQTGIEEQEVLVQLLIDLQHWCDHVEAPFDTALTFAYNDFMNERNQDTTIRPGEYE